MLVVAILAMMPETFYGRNFDRGERRIHVSQKHESVRQIEVVLSTKTPVLSFAAEELSRYINLATGMNVAIVSVPSSANVVALVLGDNKLAQTAGLDIKKLATEGFFIKRKGNHIYLLGVDSDNIDPKQNPWNMWMRRGTLSAVYDFLERFIGIRFYFAGKYGTIIPENKNLTLPVDIDIMDRPDLIGRTNYSGPRSKWYEKNNTYYGSIYGHNLNFLRWRYSEGNMPFGHGLDYIKLIERFGKSHPEYFALTPDGRRYKEADHVHPGHICFHSGITEEIYKDVKAYLTGKTPASRGLPATYAHWDVNFGYDSYVSIMPVDWLYWCCCDKCSKVAPGAREYTTNPTSAKAISSYIWKYTADIANRLRKENIKGTVTQMAYGALKHVPECDIPDNVSVQLAVNGLGAPAYWGSDVELLKKWTGQFRNKISIWTYPGKHMSKAELKGIPAMMHRETGKYLQYVRDYIYGCFLESETDYEIFHYLNYYTFAKVAWNLDTDLDQLLEEHYKLMFGAGSKEMKRFFDELEDLWCKKITGTITETALGPQMKLPNEFELWNRIYSPAKLKELNSYIDKAKKAAAGDQKVLERLDFMRREMLGPIMKRAEQFAKDRNIIGNWSFHVSEMIGLRPFKGDVCEVTTRVTVKETPDYFVFIYDCEEPFMNDMKAACREKDKLEVFTDSCVEILLNPSGDRKNYYHIGVNTNGTVADAAWQREGKPDYGWDSGCSVIVQKRANGFIINVSLPKRNVGPYKPEGFPVNFARHRAVTGDAARQIRESNYQWSPVPGRSFHAAEQWGIMNTGTPDKQNLLKDGDFDSGKVWLPAIVGAWHVWSSDSKGLTAVKDSVLDKKVFMNGTRALCLTNTAKHNIAAGQQFKGVKPNTRYRLSFFLRTRGLKNHGGAGAFLNLGKRQFAYPGIRVTGDTDWHQRIFEFKTASDMTPETECRIGLWIWNAEGKAWYDNVSITEIK